MIRFATVGTSFVTRWFLEAAGRCRDVECAAVYSRNGETAERFAKEYGVSKYYTSLEDLVGDREIDGVYLASPNSLHCGQAVFLMNRGKHVLCEKTIASNSRELALMLKTAEENGVVLMEAMRSAFDPGFAAILENLPKLGTIRKARFHYCQYSSRYGRFKEGKVENVFNPEFSGGALMDLGVYCVHPMVKLFGRPKQILAQAVMLDNGVDGAGSILADYGGMQAELSYSKISGSGLPSEIQGEEACMAIDEIADPRKLVISWYGGKRETIEIQKGERNLNFEIEEWARLIRSGETAEPHNRYSLMELEVMDEARRQIGLVFPADRQNAPDYGSGDCGFESRQVHSFFSDTEL